MGISTKMTRSCNLGCSYCYQNNARTVFNAKSANDYDIAAMLQGIRDEYEFSGSTQPVTIHGGEPLLGRKEDVEQLMRISYERVGSVSIQTNGVLIDDEWIALFRKYNVGVGVSIDGWGKLNLGRQLGGDLKASLKATRRSLKNIQKLCEKYRAPGLIVVLSKHNASPERLPELLRFLEWCQSLGVDGARLNPAHVDVAWLKSSVELTNAELANVWREVVPWSMRTGFRIPAVREALDSLMGTGNYTTCTKTYCDPLMTDAERTVREDGSRGMCEHTYGAEGITYEAAEDRKIQSIRYQILLQTPQEDGGCKDCKWWAMCSGECPGQAIDGDWRNRSRFCQSWKVLYQECADYLRRQMPNLVLLDEVAPMFDPDQLYRSVKSSRPLWDAFAFRHGGSSQRAGLKPKLQDTILRGNAVPPPGQRGSGNFTDHGDHLDKVGGSCVPREDHADIPHGDGWTHGDSDATN